MLNISNQTIREDFDATQFVSLKKVTDNSTSKIFARILLGLLIVLIIIMFLPWTQNINGRGYVTSLRPDQRPQEIHSIIAGRIEKWFVQEGDFVKAGDTILFISEIKEDYLDPKLLDRTNQQIDAKELTQKSYVEKVKALGSQIDALAQMQKLKREQAQNKLTISKLKVTTDSIEYEVAKTNFSIAEKQQIRMQQLYSEGLKSLTDLESRTLKLQESQAKLIGFESKLLSSRNELINAMIELSSIDNEYRDKLAKTRSDRFSALSSQYDADAEITKLQGQFMNYSKRSDLYYILAPQDGYITQAILTGIGETIKEGASIISIMPAKYDLAVEMYIKPMDMPLLQKGQKVRFMFDGWPAVVFSGWPNVSFGTFGGSIVAIDNFISKDDKYRIMVSPDTTETPWPAQLRLGAGANGLALLNNVPIWYELWRQINGFPPNFYTAKDKTIVKDQNK